MTDKSDIDVSAPHIKDVTLDTPEFEPFACLVAAETERRAKDRRNQSRTDGNLAAFESTYHGPEVGAVRRAFNKTLYQHMDMRGHLLDFGCGGSWWKEDYWPRFGKVTACEVDRHALEELAAEYPEAELWWTRNGLIDSDARFDVVLSSRVLGYILPEQANHHIRCAHGLLKDGGQLVVTRVLAFDLAAFLRSRRLVDIPGPSFAYHYTRRELESLLAETGFRDIRYITLGARVPGLRWEWNQTLYRHMPWVMTTLLPSVCPFMKIQHMLIARK